MIKKNYYIQKLSAERLMKCYDIAPPRVRQYLAAEIEYVRSHLKSSDRVLELGCGYGRIFAKFFPYPHTIVGIDTALESLQLGRKLLGSGKKYYLTNMDAANLGFIDNSFDVVLCIQNGLSAFKVNQLELINETLRVVRPGGKVLFSSYSEKFWDARLEWFRLHVAHGLIGEIDEELTKNGVIVCKDGFKATTIYQNDFYELTAKLKGCVIELKEIDESFLFCIINKK